jgi:hypothetical protein
MIQSVHKNVLTEPQYTISIKTCSSIMKHCTWIAEIEQMNECKAQLKKDFHELLSDRNRVLMEKNISIDLINEGIFVYCYVIVCT